MKREAAQGYKSKKQLAIELGISERTLHNYHNILINSINDFILDYPQFNDEVYTRAALSPYQSWVIEVFYQLSLKAPISLICDKCENDLYIKVIYVNMFSKSKYKEVCKKQLVDYNYDY